MKSSKVLPLIFISIVTWLLSLITQAYIDMAVFKHAPVFPSPNCAGTGYPIAMCSTNGMLTLVLCLLNIGLIYGAISVGASWIKKTR